MAEEQRAIFAAGCFWGVQAYFDQIPGVRRTRVGYTGGHVAQPTYEQVCYADTGHAEATEMWFDEKEVSYATLVKQFFRMHDPTQRGGQGPDIGDQYRSAIFYTSAEQKAIATDVKQQLSHQYSTSIVTEIKKASEFYEAEEYHQKYSEKTGRGMCHIPYAPV